MENNNKKKKNNNNNIDRKNKRKMEMDGEQQQQEQGENQENEEEKMEQFFALIRNTREMRDRLQDDHKNKKVEAEAAAAWNPTFQPEDFLENFDNIDKSKKNISHGQEDQQPGSSSEGKAEAEAKPEKAEAEAGKKEGTNNELDLNLSL